MSVQVYYSTSEEPCLDISHEKTLRDLKDTSLHSGRRAERQWTYQTCTEFGFCTSCTHLNTHTCAATHNPVPLTPVFCVCVCPCTDQTCEDTTCPFSGMVTLQLQTKVCPVAFGISQHSLPGRVAFTNAYYGGDKSNTQRVLYINGETGPKNCGQREHWDLSKVLKLHVCFSAGGIDPWKELSVVRDRTEAGGEAQTVFIEDTAHCADMMSKRVTDRNSLKRARQVTYVQYVIVHELHSYFR